ncbi:MAG TPA: transcriptional regulator [Cyanobacteria bacterium UBA8530]|nr:transcriptional regulator [Cyanobacteria bacterium UBA8530]
MSSVFKALADPTRREILARLKQGPLTAGEISEGFDISKPSVSHHLNILKGAGLIGSERNGQFLIYTMNATAFEQAAAAMLELLSPEPRKE